MVKKKRTYKRKTTKRNLMGFKKQKYKYGTFYKKTIKIPKGFTVLSPEYGDTFVRIALVPKKVSKMTLLTKKRKQIKYR